MLYGKLGVYMIQLPKKFQNIQYRRCHIKTIYLIRHAKSDWSDAGASDFERGLNRRGKRDLKTISSYFSLRKLKPDLVLSSSALRAQLTADKLSKKIQYKGRIHYMEELYMTRPETLMNILSLQDNSDESIFLVGHNPELTELGNLLIREDFTKLPTLGVLAINLEIEQWEEIGENLGHIDFFIHPKQFKYYMPKQIRATWDKKKKK